MVGGPLWRAMSLPSELSSFSDSWVGSGNRWELSREALQLFPRPFPNLQQGNSSRDGFPENFDFYKGDHSQRGLSILSFVVLESLESKSGEGILEGPDLMGMIEDFFPVLGIDIHVLFICDPLSPLQLFLKP